MLALLRNAVFDSVLPKRSSTKRRRSTARRFAVERLEARAMLTSVPFGAQTDDTGEFMLGDVLVTVVFMESQQIGSNPDNNLEDWSPAHIEATKNTIRDGLQWWEDTLLQQPASQIRSQPLQFKIDFTYADAPVATPLEPISRISNDFSIWIYDFLDDVLPSRSGDFSQDIRAFNHAQRVAHDANWAFTIFAVNSDNDPDDAFAPGGSFNRAFAFAGGQFFVMPSGRPASTVAHETGHMFWAFDEYEAGNYTDRRGYYDTQNLNALNNPDQGSIVDSIMSSGNSLQTAFNNHTSSPTSLEMIGWRDSDGNGIFDVLDVPHSLTGSGRYDVASGNYLFAGNSSVQTLANQNPSGLRNDITINKISRAEYRIDGGPWQTAQTYNAYTASLDLAISVDAFFETIEIRTVDDVTGVTSPVFVGTPEQPSSTQSTGISGFVRHDYNGDGTLQADEVTGLGGWTVQVVGASQKRVEPDDYPEDTVLTPDRTPGVTLTAIGSGVDPNNPWVVVRPANGSASTGTNVFRHFIAATPGALSADWPSTSRNLRMDFDTPVSRISLDAISNSSVDYGRLEIYDAQDNLLARYTTRGLANGQVETMTLNRSTADITYAIAKGHMGTAIQFDNLQFGPPASTVTDLRGAYGFPGLPTGSYTLEVLPPVSWSATTPRKQTVAVSDNQVTANVDFGGLPTSEAFPWQNPINRFDVDKDEDVKASDALMVISHLRQFGQHEFQAIPVDGPQFYLDVYSDNWASARDALEVISYLRANPPPPPTAAPPPSEEQIAPAAEGGFAFAAALDSAVRFEPDSARPTAPQDAVDVSASTHVATALPDNGRLTTTAVSPTRGALAAPVDQPFARLHAAVVDALLTPNVSRPETANLIRQRIELSTLESGGESWEQDTTQAATWRAFSDLFSEWGREIAPVHRADKLGTAPGNLALDLSDSVLALLAADQTV